MPPEGYDTVTLPTDLVDELDGLGPWSRATTVRHLLKARHDDEPQPVTLEATEYTKIAEQVVRELRD